MSDVASRLLILVLFALLNSDIIVLEIFFSNFINLPPMLSFKQEVQTKIRQKIK